MAKFIEVRNIEGYKILINVDNIHKLTVWVKLAFCLIMIWYEQNLNTRR